jgi:hypothetical protein
MSQQMQVVGLGKGGASSSTPTNQIKVTVTENSPETVINLGPVFGAMPGIHPEDGLQLSILGNTNSRLVKTDLSGAALTLSYVAGKCGTATITVGATDADGVSVQQTIVVTVLPLASASAGAGEFIPASPGALSAVGTLP